MTVQWTLNTGLVCVMVQLHYAYIHYALCPALEDVESQLCKESIVWSLVVVFVLENINYVCIENPPFNYGKMQTRIKYEDDLCVVVAASPRREHNSKLSGA